jgi:hypothetical protein
MATTLPSELEPPLLELHAQVVHCHEHCAETAMTASKVKAQAAALPSTTGKPLVDQLTLAETKLKEAAETLHAAIGESWKAGSLYRANR